MVRPRRDASASARAPPIGGRSCRQKITLAPKRTRAVDLDFRSSGGHHDDGGRAEGTGRERLAWPWLPDEYVMTPAARWAGVSCATML